MRSDAIFFTYASHGLIIRTHHANGNGSDILTQLVNEYSYWQLRKQSIYRNEGFAHLHGCARGIVRACCNGVIALRRWTDLLQIIPWVTK